MGREEWSMTERKKICRDCYKELTERGAQAGRLPELCREGSEKAPEAADRFFPCGSGPCGIGAGLPEPYLLGLLFSEAGRRCGRPSVFLQCPDE